MTSGPAPPSDPLPPSVNDELASLVTRCILAFEQRGDSAVDEILTAAPERAGAAREQLRALRDAGLLVPPTPDPETIGPYRILRRLGSGGVGSVFLAEQSVPVRRQVAIKVIRPGMDSREVLARFAVERQALALLDHPNVARVLDAGTTPDGRPFLCMDYVAGQPITRYSDERRLDIEQRLALMAEVCDAVQAAHQKGILHRDLKPSNILVSDRNGKPWPTVIDFGVAKSLGPRLLDITLMTGHGRLVGTLEYMSPEQAANEIDVDTRTDVHALGVVLYELLTGCLPFPSERLRRADSAELLRILRDELPPRPSAVVLGRDGADERARQRSTTAAALARTIDGELDWIAQKAIEKDRNRRYGMAADLAADLRNFLNRDPVTAGPPTAWYRWKKLIERHRLEAGSLAGILLALLAGLVTSLAFYSDAMAKTVESDASLDVALEAVERMIQAGENRLNVVPRMEEVRRELLAEALQLHRRLATTSGERRLRLSTVRALAGLANVQSQLGDNAPALDSAAEAQSILKQLPAQQRDSAAMLHLAVDLSFSQALWSRKLDATLVESAQHLDLAVEGAERALSRGEPSARFRILAAKILGTKAESLQGAQAKEARALFERSEQLLEPLLVAHAADGPPQNVSQRAQVLGAMARYASFLVKIGATEDAIAVAERLHRLAKAAFESNDDLIHRARLIPALVQIATVWYRSEQYSRVVSELEPAITVRRELIRDFPAVPAHREGLCTALINTALALERMGKLNDARAHLLEARGIFEQLLSEHPDSTRARDGLLQTVLNIAHNATVFARYGGEVDWTETDASIERGKALVAQATKADDWTKEATELAAEFARVRGLVHVLRSQDTEALEAGREAVERYDALYAEQADSVWLGSRVIDVYENYARTLLKVGEADEAAVLLQEAMKLHEELTPKLLTPSHVNSKLRQLLELQVRVAIARSDFDNVEPGIDGLLGTAKNPELDWIGRDTAAQLALEAARKAGSGSVWGQRFAARVRHEIDAATNGSQGQSNSLMVAIMRSNSLRRLVAVETEAGNNKAAAAAQTAVVEGYMRAYSDRNSDRDKRRAVSAWQQLVELRRAAADTEGAAAAAQELQTLLQK